MSDEHEFLDLSNRRLFGLLMLASRQWRLQSGRSLQDMGLSITHFPYLLCLYWKDGQTQRELSDLTLQDPATTVRAVDKLQSIGYVERRRSPSDRRVWKVFLTPRGREIEEEINQRLEKVERSALSGLDDKGLESLHACLLKVVQNLGGFEAFLRGDEK